MRISGLRFRPDIVFTVCRIAVYVDGCFWHACPRHGTTPARNANFWASKLARNRERDREANRALEAAGWVVLRFCERDVLGTTVAVADVVVEQVRASQQRGRSYGQGGGIPSP